MNGKGITNLPLLDLSLTGIASSGVSIATSMLLHPNTSILNLTDAASYGGKRLTNMADVIQLNGSETPIDTTSKLKQGVNLGTLNVLTVHKHWRDDFEDYFAFNSKIKDLDSSMYKMSDTLTIPDPIEQG